MTTVPLLPNDRADTQTVFNPISIDLSPGPPVFSLPHTP